MKLKNKIGNLIEIDWANDLHELQPDNVKVPINLDYLKESIIKHGFALPFAVWNDNGKYYCIDGHTRKQILTELIADEVEVPKKLKAFEVLAKDRTEAIKILVEVYNQKHNPFAEDVLTEWLKVEDIELESLESVNIMSSETDNLYTDNEDNTSNVESVKKLEDRFLIPPFSILDTKLGRWQQRKNYWLDKGIKSELGREAECLPTSFVEEKYGVKPMMGTSIFDPVLCELCYRWFNIDGGKILDPFAGGSVRGIVASLLGYQYLGNDLRQEQIEANRINANEVLGDNDLFPTWTIGDSVNIDKLAKGYEADMIFSCPPYADLEVYSDDPNDISNMDYEDFLNAYKTIIIKSCKLLKDDSFAVFVVGDVRDKNGFYRNFVSDTISCFQNAGLKLYNEIILVNTISSLAIRVGRQFNSGRKIGKHHQNVLVFYKGNPKNIKQKFKELDFSYLEDEIENKEYQK